MFPELNLLLRNLFWMFEKTKLDMYEVGSALITTKLDFNSLAKEIKDYIHSNKVCHHTLLSALFNDLFDVYCSYKEANDI